MPTRPDDFGPLPRADGGHELERRSLKALQAALSANDWILRDERIEDFGVDVTLEVLANGAATNFRSQVQVKARSSLRPNADGSWSVGVPVSNLNYLLSGPTPHYVLYRPESEELFVVSARDELRRIESANSAWREQAEVTLRLVERLDASALVKIRERIVREAQASRGLLDMASSLAPGARIQVDAQTLELRSPVEVEKFLLEGGMTAVTQGFGNKVLDLSSVIDAARFAAQPKLHLVRGYAEFFAGRYLRADAPLREALASGSKLDENDRHFAGFLVEAVDQALGHTTASDFRERVSAWRSQAPEMLAAQYDVLNLWMLRKEKVSPEEQAPYDKALRAALDRVAALPNAPIALVHYAESLRLFLDAQEWAARLIDFLGAASDPVLWTLHHREPPEVLLAREVAAVAAWRARADALERAVARAGNIPRFCEIRLTRDLCEEMFVSHLTTAALMKDLPPPPVPDALMDHVRKTRSFADAHGQIELELRAGLVEGALEDLRGDETAWRNTVETVLARAKALRFADIERIARRTLDDGGQSARRREIQAAAADGFDGYLSTLTEEKLDEFARNACVQLKLPSERLPVLVDAIRCESAVAIERRDWCRHLRVLEQPPAEMRPALLYARPPERRCACDRFGHESMIASPAWSQVIAAFKSVYCTACPVREPRVSS